MNAHKPILSIIVAIARNYAIGINNQLLWHLSGDLKRFRLITTGHTVVMGKRTFESLPNGPLPNRRNVVITDQAGESIEGCTMAYSMADALAKMEPGRENFIIGGGMVYRQFLPLAHKLYLTIVEQDFEADTFFPEINFAEWKLISEEAHPEHVPPFRYLIFERRPV